MYHEGKRHYFEMKTCICTHSLDEHSDIQTELVGYHKACVKCCCSDFEIDDDSQEDYIHD